MRRWIALSVFALSLMGRVSTGHEQPSCSLVVAKNWLRFELILGRLTATQLRGGQQKCVQQTSVSGGRRELLSVTGNSNAPSIRYELTDGTQRLTIEVIEGNEVRMLREPQPGAELLRLEFLQPSSGNVKLQVGDPEHPIASETAASVWHLLLAEPELCRQELMPIFDLLRPHWRLQESVERIEANLIAAATGGDGVSAANVRELVAKLDSPKFAQRQRADQQLRAMGVVVLTQFKQLDRTVLTREQRHRIDRMTNDMAVLRADTPERIVAWMLHDQAVWLSMLSRSDANKRQVAADRLCESHPAASRFDPFAEEAQRQRQIDTLRLRISTRR